MPQKLPAKRSIPVAHYSTLSRAPDFRLAEYSEFSTLTKRVSDPGKQVYRSTFLALVCDLRLPWFLCAVIHSRVPVV